MADSPATQAADGAEFESVVANAAKLLPAKAADGAKSESVVANAANSLPTKAAHDTKFESVVANAAYSHPAEAAKDAKFESEVANAVHSHPASSASVFLFRQRPEQKLCIQVQPLPWDILVFWHWFSVPLQNNTGLPVSLPTHVFIKE